jgi:hypothetical protein
MRMSARAATVIRIQAVEGHHYRLRPKAFWHGPEIAPDPCRRWEIKQHNARFLVPKSGLVDRPYDAAGGFGQRAGIGTGDRRRTERVTLDCGSAGLKRFVSRNTDRRAVARPWRRIFSAARAT